MSNNAVTPILLIGGSLAYIVGQAWNVAIQEGNNLKYPDKKRDTFRAKILYALIVTIIITIVALMLDYANRRLIHEEKKISAAHAINIKAKAYTH